MKYLTLGLTLLACPAIAQEAQSVSTTTPSASSTPVAPETPVAPQSAPVPPTTGKIILYRQSSIMGLGVACPIRYKGQEIVELGRGKFAEWNVPAGVYVVNNKTASVQVSVEAGKSSFVRCMIKPGFLSGRADLQIVDEESFNQHRNGFEKKAVNFTPSAQ